MYICSMCTPVQVFHPIHRRDRICPFAFCGRLFRVERLTTSDATLGVVQVAGKASTEKLGLSFRKLVKKKHQL